MPLTVGGGDIPVVTDKHGAVDKTLHTLIGGGVPSEPAEGKASLVAEASESWVKVRA